MALDFKNQSIIKLFHYKTEFHSKGLFSSNNQMIFQKIKLHLHFTKLAENQINLKYNSFVLYILFVLYQLTYLRKKILIILEFNSRE